MKQFIAYTAIALMTALPLSAETDDSAEVEEGLSLMEQGAKLLLRGFMTEMEPAIEELKGMSEEMSDAMALFTAEMGPALAEMMTRIDDLRNYDSPEIMPNGDIIIRRKPDAPIFEMDPETGEVDL
ncbi:MAG: hypothetical protein KC439_08210 [Yoonia sp.]|nr:hypothetical protein [Yoonia sp.]